MKAVILARVSTKEQEEEGHSLPAQTRRLQEYAQKKGFEIVKEFVFSESAGEKIRTKFEEMLSYLRKNPDVRVILSTSVDRVTRNFRDAVDLDNWRREKGLEIHFVQDGFLINKDATGNQLFMWEAKVFLAKQYLNRLSDDVKRSAEHKILSGEWYGRCPVGFKNITSLENGKKWIVPDEEKAPFIQMMYQEYATGQSTMEMLRVKAKEAGITNSKGQITKILKNPFYYGDMLYKEKLYPHKYEALVSEELWDKVQKVKARYNKKSFKFAEKPILFRGLIRCAEASCGCAISFDQRKKHYKETNRTATYVYGRCTNYHKVHKKNTWIKEDDLVNQLAKLLRTLIIPKDKLSKIIKILKRSHEDKQFFHKQALRSLKREYEMIQNRIDTMYEDKLDKKISVEYFEKKLIEYKQKQEEITERLKTHTLADKNYYEQASKFLKFACRAHDILRGPEVDKKRELLKYALQDLRLNGKKLEIKLSRPLSMLQAFTSSSQWLPEGSNRKNF